MGFEWRGGVSGLCLAMIGLAATPAIAKPTPFTVEGNRLQIELPGTARIKPASQFGVEIAVNNRIQLMIETLASETSISEYRKDTLANTGIFQRFIVDSPTVLLHEDKIMSQPIYRVFTYIDTGKVKVTCRDSRAIDLTEAEARTVIQLCQSIRPQS